MRAKRYLLSIAIGFPVALLIVWLIPGNSYLVALAIGSICGLAAISGVLYLTYRKSDYDHERTAG